MTMLVLSCAVCVLCVLSNGTESAAPAAVLVGALQPVATLRRRRGRPRKFDEPTRVVSLTLPESVIALLSTVHADLGHAVTGLIRGRSAPAPRSAAELVNFGNRAVISVRPSRELARRLGVELVPLADDRALIAFDAPQTIADLELRIQDVLEDTDLLPADRVTCEGIRDILRDGRRSRQVTLLRRNIIVLEARRQARRRAGGATDDAV